MEHMVRPSVSVLPESALVPEQNLLKPPPNQFSHVVTVDQPYYFQPPGPEIQAGGLFLAGTQVLLIARTDGPMCHVADGRGIYVLTLYEGIRRITDQS
jgi:hypothetical protein